MSDQLPGTKGDLEDAYDYTLKGFDTMKSCPPCRAKEMRDAIDPPTSMYTKGQSRACTVVLSLGVHECDEFKGKKQGDINA